MRRTIGLAVVSALLLAACSSDTSNNDTTGTALAEGDLIITEVMLDADDTYDDWVEFRNVSGHKVCVAGLRVTAAKTEKLFAIPATVETCLLHGEFFVVGTNEHDFVGFSSDKIVMPTTDGQIALFHGATEIARVTYDRTDPDRTRTTLGAPSKGKSFSLCGTCMDYDCMVDSASWVLEESEKYDDKNYGTPGTDTVCGGGDGDVIGDVVTHCVPPEPGDLAISEVLANPYDEETGEWLEVIVGPNAAGKHLNGVAVYTGDTKRGEVSADACIPLEPGSHLLLAKSEFPIGEEGPAADAVLKLTLPNNGDAITLKVGDIVIDETAYDSEGEGLSWSLSGKYTTADENDEPLNWCSTQQTDEYALADPAGGTVYATPGTPNGNCPLVCPAGQCILGEECLPIMRPAPGELLITEVMASSQDDDVGEWFEIYALPAAQGKHANGLEILIDGEVKNTIEPAANECLPFAADAYAVVADDSDHLDHLEIVRLPLAKALSLTNTGKELALQDSDTGETIVAVPNDTEKGSAWQLGIDSYDSPDNPNSWCHATESEGNLFTAPGDPAEYGTPGAANTSCPLVCEANECIQDNACVTIDPLPVGALVLTEFLSDPGPGDGDGEWLEFYVTPAAEGKHLNGLTVVVGDDPKDALDSPDGTCLLAPPETYLVIGKSTALFDSEDAPTADLLCGDLTLPNDPKTVRLEQAGEIIDEADYKNKDGASYQLAPEALDATANNLEANWCHTPQIEANLVEEGTWATPGAANVPCVE